MIQTIHAPYLSGEVLGLADGHLAITVAKLPDGLLALLNGQLGLASPDAIAQRPALCRQCGHAGFWWDHGHFVPWCLTCVPPDAAWRSDTLVCASAFVDRTGEGVLRLLFDWMAVQPRIGEGGWAMAQQLAFVGRIEPLLADWHERQGFPD